MSEQQKTQNRRPTAAIYKGKKYKVLFAGHTKNGDRAKLGRFDRTGDGFWVDLREVEFLEDNRPREAETAEGSETTEAPPSVEALRASIDALDAELSHLRTLVEGLAKALKQ